MGKLAIHAVAIVAVLTAWVPTAGGWWVAGQRPTHRPPVASNCISPSRACVHLVAKADGGEPQQQQKKPTAKAGGVKQQRQEQKSATKAGGVKQQQQKKKQKAPSSAATGASQLKEPCNVVLTHTNADFDSLAGAVALARLWSVTRPEFPTHVVMPRGVNPNVARFLAYHKHLLPIRGFGTIRAEDVCAVGIVDTQFANRLGPAASWLEEADHVAVFDHHSEVEGDIAFDELHIEPVGSATTVLVERLRALIDEQIAANASPGDGTNLSRPPLQLSEADATLFALGIRADTGALSYAGTTARDGHALVYLMECGASQVAIAEFGQARLSATQRDLLAAAMSSVERTMYEGIKIGVVQLDTGRGFVTGMSAVAEELLQLMSFDVLLLAVVHENSKAQGFLSLIGRCSPRAKEVDLNEIMKRWSGGGHPAASAASLRLTGDSQQNESDPTAPAADVSEEERRVSVLKEVARIVHLAAGDVKAMIPEQVQAAQLMTKTVFTCSPTDSMVEAMQLMDRMETKAVPVTDEDRKLMGMLKYKDVVKAAQAGKGDERVKAWMRREVVTVREDTPFDQLEKVLVDQQTGRLPVVDGDGVLVGLVTRTDVLREHKLYGGLGRRVA